MAECARCKAETFIYDGVVPICTQCSEERQRKLTQNVLVDDIVGATARVSAANHFFHEVINQVPSGLPHPVGSQRIHEASGELDIARQGMMKAHNRLNDFVDRGIVPEDLRKG